MAKSIWNNYKYQLNVCALSHTVKLINSQFPFSPIRLRGTTTCGEFWTPDTLKIFPGNSGRHILDENQYILTNNFSFRNSPRGYNTQCSKMYVNLSVLVAALVILVKLEVTCLSNSNAWGISDPFSQFGCI